MNFQVYFGQELSWKIPDPVFLIIFHFMFLNIVRAGLIEGKVNEKKNEIKRTDFRFSRKTAG